MPDASTLELVAELIARRVAEECANMSPSELAAAFERAYPFGDFPGGREIWEKAVSRWTPPPQESD
jgi:hypothetical protein